MTLEWLIMIDEHYAIDQWLPNLRQACVRDKKLFIAIVCFYYQVRLKAVWSVKNRQMSIKVAQKMIPPEKWKILTPLQKMPKMWAIWAKQLLSEALKSCPECNKSPNLVTLIRSLEWRRRFAILMNAVSDQNCSTDLRFDYVKFFPRRGMLLRFGSGFAIRKFLALDPATPR